MEIQLRLFGRLHSLLREGELRLDFQGHTLKDLVEELAARYGPVVKQELLDEKGNLDYSYALFLRGERVTSLALPLREGDEVSITSMLAGGCSGAG